MNALDKLKNKYQAKEYKDKNTIEACSKLKHSLDTSELYLKANSQSIDPTVLGLVYRQIVKSTSPILPKNCNITKPVDLTHHDYNNWHVVEASHYSVKRFAIDKSAKDNPLIQYSYSFYTEYMDSKIYHDLLKYNFSKMKSLQKHEQKIKKYFSRTIMCWIITCVASVIGVIISAFFSIYLTAIFLTLAAIIFFLIMPTSFHFSDKYDNNHYLSNVNVVADVTDNYNFLDVIHKLKDNVTKLMSLTKEDKQSLINDYNVDITQFREEHQLNLPPIKHLKQIENKGNDWSTLSKKALKLEKQHKI